MNAYEYVAHYVESKATTKVSALNASKFVKRIVSSQIEVNTLNC